MHVCHTDGHFSHVPLPHFLRSSYPLLLSCTFPSTSSLLTSPDSSNLKNIKNQSKRRSKLYVFGEAMLDKGSGKKTWLERGIGEVKLLK